MCLEVPDDILRKTRPRNFQCAPGWKVPLAPPSHSELAVPSSIRCCCFLSMTTLSLFTVNGVSATALVDLSLQTTTLSASFASRLALSDGDNVIISAPLQDKTVCSSVIIHIAHHSSDIVVGVDWFRQNAGQRLGRCACCFGPVRRASSDLQQLAGPSLAVGFQSGSHNHCPFSLSEASGSSGGSLRNGAGRSLWFGSATVFLTSTQQIFRAIQPATRSSMKALSRPFCLFPQRNRRQ